MSLCRYSKLFGEPNQGAHKYRLFGIAVVDLVLTILLAIVIARWKKWNVLVVFLALMVLALILHRLFCVKTTLTKKVFGNF